MAAGAPMTATHRVTIPLHGADDARRTADLLSELLWPPADAVGLRETRDGLWRVDAYFALPPRRDQLERFLRETCGLAASPPFAIEELAPTDWVAASQAARPPVAAGRFIVHGAHDRQRVGHRRWAIEIEAGQAFGTGHHGSTAGCLAAIDRVTRRAPPRRALDVGTGSGVLAVALAKAGCPRVLACDNDPLAVAAARQAVKENGVASRVRAKVASGLGHRLIGNRAPYDLVAANILARPLAGLAGAIARHTRPRSVVVLSGLLDAQSGPLAARYRAHGFALADRVRIGDWTTLVLRRH